MSYIPLSNNPWNYCNHMYIRFCIYVNMWHHKNCESWWNTLIDTIDLIDLEYLFWIFLPLLRLIHPLNCMFGLDLPLDPHLLHHSFLLLSSHIVDLRETEDNRGQKIEIQIRPHICHLPRLQTHKSFISTIKFEKT